MTAVLNKAFHFSLLKDSAAASITGPFLSDVSACNIQSNVDN